MLTGLQVDSGWFPSANDPLAIRFYILPLGGLTTTLQGTSELQWGQGAPGTVQHRVIGQPSGTDIELDATVDVGIDVKIDVVDVLTDVVTLVGTEARFEGRASHDTLLLPGQGRVGRVRDALEVFAWSTDLEVIPGVDLVVGVEVAPILTAEVRGAGVESVAFGVPRRQTLEGQWVDQPAPPGASEHGLTVAWAGDVTGELELGLQPEVSLDTPVGNFRILRVRVPIPIQRFQELRLTPPQFLVHPLPSLDLEPVDHDFGDVGVGDLALLELSLDNLGLLALEGTALVRGSGAFAVFPEELAAAPDGGGDGVVITFSPRDEGIAEAEVVLSTNDPWQPDVVFRVRGRGVDPASLDRFAGGATCGCQAPASSSAGALGVAGLAALLLLRRRRSAAEAPRGCRRRPCGSSGARSSREAETTA